jgi:hypothetical protein
MMITAYPLQMQMSLHNNSPTQKDLMIKVAYAGDDDGGGGDDGGDDDKDKDDDKDEEKEEDDKEF